MNRPGVSPESPVRRESRRLLRRRKAMVTIRQEQAWIVTLSGVVELGMFTTAFCTGTGRARRVPDACGAQRASA